MERYTVTGMSCAACSARVEKTVSALEGVDRCSVNLLTNSMMVEGTASKEAVMAAVKAAGYRAYLMSGTHVFDNPQAFADSRASDNPRAFADPRASADSRAFASKGTSVPDGHKDPLDAESRAVIYRLIWSIVFLLPLMYISMGVNMFGFPVPLLIRNNPVCCGIVQMQLALAVMIINKKFFINGYRGLVHRAPNMDTLVALGSSVSYVYSTVALIFTAEAVRLQDTEKAAVYSAEFYFESAAMILVLITVGKLLEAKSKGRTTDAVKSLINLAPKMARVISDGREVTVPLDALRTGDIFCVYQGDSIPADGVVIEGEGSVDESALTGESIPCDKTAGDTVSQGTISMSGFIRCRAKGVGDNTALSRIIRTVTDAAGTKAPIARLADRVSGVFVPFVLAVSLLTTVGWLIAGYGTGFAIARGISVLVISCPCALGLATPVAIMVGTGMGARNGIIFRTAEILENMGRSQVVVLDKTGTITEGRPEVTDIYPAETFSETELMKLACSLEIKSSHPLAEAVTRHGENNKTPVIETDNFRIYPGNGLTATAGEIKLAGGNYTFICGQAEGAENFLEIAQKCSDEGKTPIYFSYDNKVCGLIAVADVIKPEAPEAVGLLKNLGIRCIMLTGDNERTARAIAAQTGIDEVTAGVLPDEKEHVVRRLQDKGLRVCMVGDGINDAPALTAADVGVAIGAGSDIAIESADVVLVRSRLTDVPAAIRLSRLTINNIKQNLFWAFFYNCAGIPLAMGLFYPAFGLKLSPVFGAAAMSLSSFFVVTNALRLNYVKLHNAVNKEKYSRTSKAPGKEAGIQEPGCSSESGALQNGKCDDNTEKRSDNMKKNLTISGMMCMHCEAHVKKALEAIDGVAEAVPSHEAGNCEVRLEREVDDAVLREAVEKEGYSVEGID